jgi:ATP-dependent DNA ligase
VVVLTEPVADQADQFSARANIARTTCVETLASRRGRATRKSGTANLDEAIAAYREALKEMTRFEGIVSKHREHPYRSGPSKVWLKIKNPAAPGVLRFKDEP